MIGPAAVGARAGVPLLWSWYCHEHTRAWRRVTKRRGPWTATRSPIRRASEMAHIDQIFQIGLRSTGSARVEEVDAATAYGAHLIAAHELHDVGMDAILARIPDGGRYYITIDMDGMDPSIAPAVAALAPGGVTFPQARKLIHGLVKKGRVVGMDVVEITPGTDVNDITCITAGRLIVNLIGAAVRAGYFNK